MHHAYKMDNFSKLKQFKSESEISADPVTPAKLPAGIDETKKGSIHDISFYIGSNSMNEWKYFSKLKQFKSKSEIFADPLTAAKLPAGIDQSKKESIHYITFYILSMNECMIGQKKLIIIFLITLPIYLY